jgi:hypothetical protein
MFWKSIFLIITGCIFCSCSHRKSNSFSLDKKIKTEAKTLKVDTVGFFEDLIYAKEFYVYSDSILIVRNREYKDVYFLEFYNMNQNRLLAQRYRYGNGPDELLSARVTINGSMLTINDYVADRAVFLNIDSVLQNPFYKISPKRYYFHSPTVVQYKETQFLIQNPNCFRNKELGIDQQAPRFIATDMNSVYVEQKKYKYYTWNVAANGRIITNYSRNRIVYTDLHLPYIELYDNELNLLKLITGPDQLHPKYIISDDNEIIFRKEVPFAYLSFCTDSNYFYVIYMGDFINFNDKNEEDFPSWIFKFDWDGNVVESFYAGRYIWSITPSGDGKGFYATATSEEKSRFLIKLNIDEN